ncbi:hypothetical protein RHSIM_Rhsim04G0135500 [Rhododendron simsii]|uniref:Reverse transcriptase zinc-binding domain-containing protein n=1 Tax=Rhododendron simsii TaxID=118357 RepID=A0A834H449_RHOSS|nr:hypothetical protein RHSIM_Rhsim04G0135500 [Rhododendron simsii]
MDVPRACFTFFVSRSEALKPTDSQEDCLQWKWSKDLSFQLSQHTLSGKPKNSLRTNICPPKVEIFVWMDMQGCIASKSVLVRRGIINNNLGQYPFCNATKETPDHLLLLCDVACRLQIQQSGEALLVGFLVLWGMDIVDMQK